MGQVCGTCSAANANDAVYCAQCGHVLKRQKAAQTDQPVATRRRPVLVVALLSVLALAGLYFWLFIMDDLTSAATSPESTAINGVLPDAKIFFAMTDANIRDKPSLSDSTILGKLPRGSQVTGVVQSGSGPNADWLKLNDGNGFVALVNLSPIKPPVLVKALNDQAWTADTLLDMWATPLPDSSLLERIRPGTKLTLAGVTAANFLEVKLAGGGYGYIAGADAILARLGGKLIAIEFSPQTCAFSGEIGAEFAKIGATMQTKWQTLESQEFANEAAREQAYGDAEGKSSYVRLRRSFQGLSLTGVGQHYESQSLYFDDPPAKVIEVFRALGFSIGRDGQFASTELYAGITATRGEGAAYGKTELSCGV